MILVNNHHKVLNQNNVLFKYGRCLTKATHCVFKVPLLSDADLVPFDLGTCTEDMIQSKDVKHCRIHLVSLITNISLVIPFVILALSHYSEVGAPFQDVRKLMLVCHKCGVKNGG